MSKTRIICTLGPASSDENTIAGLVLSGIDVARINFSHGTHEEICGLISKVRKVSSETGNPVAILGDIAGPKIRICELEREPLVIAAGEELTITTREPNFLPQHKVVLPSLHLGPLIV